MIVENSKKKVVMIKNTNQILTPNFLSRNLKSLDDLPLEHVKYISEQLNRHLQIEIENTLGEVSIALARRLKPLINTIDYNKFVESNVSTIIYEQVLQPLKKKVKDKKLLGEIETVENRLKVSTPIKIKNFLSLDSMINENPIFAADIQSIKVLEYSKLAGLNENTTRKLLDSNLLNFDDSDETNLSVLIKKKIIDEKQKQNILLISSLSRLTGDNLPLIKALKTRDLKSISKFVSWDRDDWKNILKQERISIPTNQDIDSYIESIVFSLKRTYPSQFLVDRCIKKNINKNNLKRRIGLVDSLNVLLKNNNSIIRNDKSKDFDWRGISSQSREKIESQLLELESFNNLYSSLELDTVINNKHLDISEKKQKIDARLQHLNKFFENNPDIDLRYADFFEDKNPSISWKEIPQIEKPLIRKQIMAYQRILNIIQDPEDSLKILEKRFDSVLSISEISEREFIQKSGLNKGKARMIYAQAHRYSEIVANNFESIRDVLKGQFKDIRMSNLDTKAFVNELKKINGYADLFGPQNFCGCEECMSILSPAAYFVDLMRFIDTNVSKQVFDISDDPNDPLKNHPLYLKNRRRDLWNLELTCENTHTLVPYLTIVNEVLEQYLESLPTPIGGSGSDEDIYEKISKQSAKTSFSLPFNLPLKETSLYLSHFGTSLHQIYSMLNSSDQKIWRARLELSQEEYRVIIHKEDPIDDVRLRFGNCPSLDDFLVQDFIRFAGITREDLDLLLNIKYNPDLGNIVIEQLDDPNADDILQNYPEILNGLTNERADFIHRFLRLQKKTPWNISEMDMILTSLYKKGLIDQDIDYRTVINVAKLVDVQEKLKLSVDDLCAIHDELPVSEDYPQPRVNSKSKTLFERIFDPKKIFGIEESTGEIKSSKRYYHYTFDTANPDDVVIDSATPHLLAGLAISETELLLLFDLLKDNIAFDPDGYCDDFDKTKISLLYRYCKLAKSLRLKISDFILILHLIFHNPATDNPTEIKHSDQVFKLIDFVKWMQKNPLNPSELFFIERGETRNGIINPKSTIDDAISLVLLIRSNPMSNVIDSLKSGLSTQLNLSVNQVSDIVSWLTTDINSGEIRTALDAQFENRDIDGTIIQVPVDPDQLIPLLEMLVEIERIMLLFGQLKFNENIIHFITTNKQLFGINELHKLTIENIISISLFKNHINLEDTQSEFLVQSILQSYFENGNKFSESVSMLTLLWKKDFSLLSSLVKALTRSGVPAIPIRALEFLKNCLNLCEALGINGFSFANLGKDSDYASLIASRNIALGTFNLRYENEKTRKEKLEPHTDNINTIKRDILCSYIIAHQSDLKFKNHNDIYSFFLLDVEMGGCFRTSRIVCAISSLQFYIHRCLVNLERSASTDVKVDPSLIPVDEWEWRKNYRVAEANKKVFLYPENYLEPDLRDNKTFLFKELESELLQEKITMDSAEAAYRNYLSQFAELTRLKFAGSYFHNGTYYFFGCTQHEAPEYYYRKWILGGTWTSWEKINLSIKSHQISAIVYFGKLYLFWSENLIKSKTEVDASNNIKTIYYYTKDVLYSFLNEQNRWMLPQTVPFRNIKSSKGTGELTKFVFPLIHNNRVHITGYERVPYITIDADSPDQGAGKISKLDFFRNNISEISQDIPGLIDPRPDLLFIEKDVIDQIDSCRLRIDGEDYNRKHEYLHEVGIEIPRNGSVIDKIPLTNYFIKEDYYPELHIVGYRPGDYIFSLGTQQYLIQRQYGVLNEPPSPLPITNQLLSNNSSLTMNFSRLPWEPLSKRYMFRLGTSIVDEIGEILFTRGLLEFLSLSTQRKKEHPIAVEITEPSEILGPYDGIDHIDFNGAYGIYYQELFFHIPFLIANHLNSCQKFKESKWWYECIFDPTSNIEELNSPPSNLPWQYIAFRKNNVIEKMRDILTNVSALNTYENDPFNPHAIARLRLSAYQKAVVMKYIDNLIDWADYLFAQDTMESINEATMLYVLASDILGERPLEIGKCKIAMDIAGGGENGEGEEEEEGEEDGQVGCTGPLTYNKILTCSVNTGTDFLIELENYHYSLRMDSEVIKLQMMSTRDSAIDTFVTNNNDSAFSSETSNNNRSEQNNLIQLKPRYNVASFSAINKSMEYGNLVLGSGEIESRGLTKKQPGSSMVIQSKLLAFCIPPNHNLLEYWDRIKDRLFKIRNCMNISGIRRQLALFQPPIDPMMLVRAKAAGLTLEQIFSPAIEFPPYRFLYLLEKAKQFSQTLQNFGSGLLSALEKRDVEELSLLRSVHERNILRMMRETKVKQLTESQHQYATMSESVINVQNRIDYYNALISEGLNNWERKEQFLKQSANWIKAAEGTTYMLAGLLALIPNYGSAFAYTYGGKELHKRTEMVASSIDSSSKLLEARASSAGIEGSNIRREQEWNQQLKLAIQEMKQTQQQQLASAIKVEIAEKDLLLHDKNIEQADEIDEFYRNKFTNLGLYSYLANLLNRLFREAYNLAYDMSLMAERAYRFETGDTTIYITADNWSIENAGLLAGERLLVQLQQLETSFIKNHKREPEITQSFSLSLLKPLELIKLREIGECEFDIPEEFFDFYYPGQYKRIIKSVRLTIPCIVGPYANVSSKLTLLENKVRLEPKMGIDPEPDPNRNRVNSTSISTSNAQGDSGMFEFSFRDERYLPFEGAGAISSWKLELPRTIRVFDYDTISDIILHISYVAMDGDSIFRDQVEEDLAEKLSRLSVEKGLFRLFSLRHEMPNNLHQLLHPQEGQPQRTKFKIERKHFPYFLSKKNLDLSEVKIYLKHKLDEGEINTSSIILNINNIPISTSSWNDFEDRKNIQEATISITGSPLREWEINAEIDDLNRDELEDVMILLKYEIS